MTRSCCSSDASVPSSHTAVAKPCALLSSDPLTICALRPIGSQIIDAPAAGAPLGSLTRTDTPPGMGSPGAPTHVVSVAAPTAVTYKMPGPVDSSAQAAKPSRRATADERQSHLRCRHRILTSERPDCTSRRLPLGMRMSLWGCPLRHLWYMNHWVLGR